MSSFTDRIRARTRRANERRAQQPGQQPHRARREVAAEFAPLALDRDQVAAIQTALGDHKLEPVVAQQEPSAGTAAHMAPEQLDAGQLDDSTTPDEQASAVSPAVEEPVSLPAAPETPAVADATLERIEFPKSSNVRAASVDIHGVLTVEFTEGKRYRYANFTLELLREWHDAKSAGGWFAKNVRSKPERHPVLEG